LSSTCFKHPSVHPQEALYMLFYVTFFMHPYRQSGRCQDVFEYQNHETACTTLPEDEHLSVRNMSKTI